MRSNPIIDMASADTGSRYIAILQLHLRRDYRFLYGALRRPVQTAALKCNPNKRVHSSIFSQTRTLILIRGIVAENKIHDSRFT